MCGGILYGPQGGILTDNAHTQARIKHITTTRLQRALAAGVVPVVAGFQGISSGEDLTTLGRGGSDLTAVALAAALQADRCEIYTDVDGVYSADPNIVPAGAAAGAHLVRRDAGNGPLRGQGPASALGRVRQEV